MANPHARERHRRVPSREHLDREYPEHRDARAKHERDDGAFVTMGVFLGLNGYEIEAPETEVVTVMLALAADELGGEEFASWLRSRPVPRPDGDAG